MSTLHHVPCLNPGCTWPMRCARSSACTMSPGVQEYSQNTQLEAAWGAPATSFRVYVLRQAMRITCGTDPRRSESASSVHGKH
jgi:hypothetical protein